MAKVDAYALQPEDYDEIPELTDEMVMRAQWYVGGRPVAPDDPDLKEMRLPEDTIAQFEALSPGWLERVRAKARESAAAMNGNAGTV
jgi:hypothetical protein